MKNAKYQSVPLVASVIRSVSGKAIYLTHVTSLDGSRLYSDGWCPVRWGKAQAIEWRYTDKPRNINNVLVIPGTYYKFSFKNSVLMTTTGPVNEHGAPLQVPGLVKHIIQGTRQVIDYEFHSQSLVELPMSKVTPSMDIDRYKDNCSMIKSRLVDGQVKEYLQLTDRWILHIPKFAMGNLKERALKRRIMQEDLFTNDENPESIIEQVAYDTDLQDKFSYLDRAELFQDARPASSNSTRDALRQWELDNPDYSSTEWS